MNNDSNYIDKQKDHVRKFLEKSQYKDSFNDICKNGHDKSFIHILVGVQEYLRKYYRIKIDWNEQSEYIIPNITDKTFSGISQNGKGEDYEDQGIDGLLYIDSKGKITSSEDTNISEIIVYQSKSGKSGKLKNDINNLSKGIRFLFSGKTNDVTSKEVYENAIKKIKENPSIIIHPLYISLDKTHSNKGYNTLLDNTIMLEEPRVVDDLNEILFYSSHVNRHDVKPTEKSSLKCLSIQPFSYPGSKISPYISFVYLRDYINFLNLNSEEESTEKESTEKESTEEESTEKESTEEESTEKESTKKESKFELDEGLFSKNVRRNIGKNNPLNKKIRDTFFKGPSEQFGDIWWISNGITIVADSMENQNGTLKLIHPSIINGQQTSRQLFEALKKDEKQFYENNPSYSPWKFMIKIFIADTSDEEVSENISSIIVGLNSQSAINKNSISLVNDKTIKISEYLHKSSDEPKYFLEVYSGEYTKDDFYKEHDKREDIITIESLVQYALSAGLNNGDNNNDDMVSIGKIRSSKNSIISKYHENIFEKNSDPKFWYHFIHAIKTFEKNLEYTEEDKIIGLQYLTFALFRLAYKKFREEKKYKNKSSMRSFCGELTKEKLKYIKNKLKFAMDKQVDDKNQKITNWDQYSKKEAFQTMLDSIDLQH